MNIKSEKTSTLARRLAALTGETITEAVTRAIEERLAALGVQEDEDQARQDAALDEMIERLKALPVLDDRSDEDIAGYDETGAWR